jgi:predicted RNA-binding Zn ribbon-like protein
MRDEAPYFPLLGEPLALDLANTIVHHAGQDLDLLTDERQLQAWLDQQGPRLPPAEATKQVLAAVHSIRRPLRRCLDAVRDHGAPPADAIAALNRAAAAAPASVAMQLDPSGRPQRLTRRPGPAANQVAAVLAEAAIQFLTDHDPRRLRQCAAEDCILLFYAAHPRRRWCSADGCGNRERVRRHYQRHRN